MHFQLWTAIWVVYLNNYRGFSLIEITTLDGIFFLATVLAELPTGVVADRYGRKLSLILSSATLAIAVFVFGIADHYLVVVLSYIFWGIAEAFESGANSALLYDSLRLAGRTEDYTRMQGRMNASGFAAGLAGGLIGAPLAAATNLAVPVLASAVLAALGIVVALLLQEPPRGIHERRLSYRAIFRAGLDLPRRDPALRYALLFAALAAGTMFSVFSQPFLIGHGVQVGSLGLLQLPMRLAWVVGALVAARLVSRLGDWRFFALMPVLGGVSLLALAVWDSVYAFAFFPLLGLASTLRSPVLVRYINERTPSEVRASVLSLLSLAASLGMLTIEPVIGYIAEVAGLRAAFGCMAVLCVTSLSVLLYYWHRATAHERLEVPVEASR